MWRHWFYEKSWFGRYIYKPLVGSIAVLAIAVSVYNRITSVEPKPWAFLIVLVGFVAFLIAKISVLKTGKFISFGASATAQMSWPMVSFYWGGYALMVGGAILTF